MKGGIAEQQNWAHELDELYVSEFSRVLVRYILRFQDDLLLYSIFFKPELMWLMSSLQRRVMNTYNSRVPVLMLGVTMTFYFHEHDVTMSLDSPRHNISSDKHSPRKLVGGQARVGRFLQHHRLLHFLKSAIGFWWLQRIFWWHQLYFQQCSPW